MTTLAQHIDELDRMVDGNADKAKIKSYIRLIYHEAVRLETDFFRLSQEHTLLEETHARLQAQMQQRSDPSRGL